MDPPRVGQIPQGRELRLFTKCGCHGFVGHMSKVFDTPLRGQFVLESRLTRNKSDGANEAFTAFAFYAPLSAVPLRIKKQNDRKEFFRCYNSANNLLSNSARSSQHRHFGCGSEGGTAAGRVPHLPCQPRVVRRGPQGKRPHPKARVAALEQLSNEPGDKLWIITDAVCTLSGQ